MITMCQTVAAPVVWLGKMKGPWLWTMILIYGLTHNGVSGFFANYHIGSTIMNPKSFLSSFGGSGGDVSNQDLDRDMVLSIYSKHCDKNGFVTKSGLAEIPFISDLLKDDLLMNSELDEIWKKVRKRTPQNVDTECVDIDSFFEIFENIDELFEPYETVDESGNLTSTQHDFSVQIAINDSQKSELVNLFQNSLCDGEKKLSKQSLRQWEDVSGLIDQGLLEEAEFNMLWNNASHSKDYLDLDGFLSFNRELDELYELEDAFSNHMDVFRLIADLDGLVGMKELKRWTDLQDKIVGGKMSEDVLQAMLVDVPKCAGGKLDFDGFRHLCKRIDSFIDHERNANDSKHVQARNGQTWRMEVVEDDLPADILFQKIADDNLLIGTGELSRWGILRDMINSGDLLSSELQDIFDRSPKSKENTSKLGKQGFLFLYQQINDLFEVYDEEVPAKSEDELSKRNLLKLLDNMNKEDRSMCGIDASEKEEAELLNVISEVESLPQNLLEQMQGQKLEEYLAGDWDLIYTSSPTVRFNKGISGLARSIPSSDFAGLKQKLVYTRFAADTEFIEKIRSATGPFDVRVSGNWEMVSSQSILTGAKSTSLKVVPQKVEYASSKFKADYWKTLGPVTFLDITYLDKNLRIMRGNTATKTVFVFTRDSTSSNNKLI
mmetsp:Transcript_8783/g.13604  ORF Transcript_8783/g.13604 Transcript_8783/m.13604 type:complete len:662 (+) Transcript_8783:97-2082(+)